MVSLSPTHILVVDDDQSVRAILRELFEGEGYVVHEARNSSQVFDVLRDKPIKLVTMDLGLDGENGLTLSKQIADSYDIPLIMVTARASDIDRILGLELGADDYIVKPFNLREVLARVRAVLRRAERTATESKGAAGIAFGDWSLNVATRELTNRSGQMVDLTAAEFDLLEIFLRHRGQVFSRNALIDMLKGGAATPYDRSIDTLVARLRKKIEPDCERPVFIKTIRNAGYLFTHDTD